MVYFIYVIVYLRVFQGMYENVIGNFVFVVLLSVMLWSWVQPFFPHLRTYTAVSPVALGLANSALAALLVLRWWQSGHFPLSNLYESLVFLAWAFTALHLVCLRVFTTYRDANRDAKQRDRRANSDSTGELMLTALTAPTALLTYTFASFSLPAEMQHASALVPALQSNWLCMHVSVMIFSYAALLFGSLCALVFLVVPDAVKFQPRLDPSQSDHREADREATPQLSAFGLRLDNYSYRLLGIGFPLLTMGIVSGAVWANEAWGAYWSWDPKETWALITWLVFAIYFHARVTRGWIGTAPARIAAGGFVTVWVTYLGVNVLGSGLHSYGWFTS